MASGRWTYFTPFFLPCIVQSPFSRSGSYSGYLRWGVVNWKPEQSQLLYSLWQHAIHNWSYMRWTKMTKNESHSDPWPWEQLKLNILALLIKLPIGSFENRDMWNDSHIHESQKHHWINVTKSPGLLNFIFDAFIKKILIQRTLRTICTRWEAA